MYITRVLRSRINTIAYFVLSLVLFAVQPAFGSTDDGRTVSSAGVNVGAGWAYFYVKNGLSVAGCNGGTLLFIRIDSAGAWKATYATVLTAQALNKTLYVAYSKASDNNCFVNQVGMNSN